MKKNEKRKEAIAKGFGWYGTGWYTMIMSILIIPPVKPRARESSDSLFPTTYFPQKRDRHEVVHGKQGGKDKKMTAGTSTPTTVVMLGLIHSFLFILFFILDHHNNSKCMVTQ